ncbi:methyltransferase domain-containing protein [Streptomyces sp. NBC_01190]|uniref:methyltransferase domain-containing protein n=1 Tax=Streptomyces sp. NBC_01190 TaxID=2903767 RepID=UPI003863A077|nr:methyltransferase domain-containing protein [Streptomyces sp. NBC_01190]
MERSWAALGRELFESAALAPDWAPAFADVPRCAFLPELMWPYDPDAGDNVAVAKSADPWAWQAYAHADVPIVTQWDDGRHTGTSPGRVASSSASMPSVVASMLARLDVRPGLRILEIGTGTGWNAGLLAHRLGDAAVTSVEVDPAVAATARAALARAGLNPTVITGDGSLGHPPGAPYDRIIATCGLREIPAAWIEQIAPGGFILAPWGTHYANGDAIVRLAVDGAEACGRFGGLVEFMKLRAQRRATIRHRDYVPPEGTDTADRSVSTLTETRFHSGPQAPDPFVLGLLVRDCVQAVAEKRGRTRPIWFYSRTDRSWAVIVFRDGHRESVVHQSGPRRLWDEVESAVRWWESHGRPTPTRFGLTVTPPTHHIWLNTPHPS